MHDVSAELAEKVRSVASERFPGQFVDVVVRDGEDGDGLHAFWVDIILTDDAQPETRQAIGLRTDVNQWVSSENKTTDVIVYSFQAKSEYEDIDDVPADEGLADHRPEDPC